MSHEDINISSKVPDLSNSGMDKEDAEQLVKFLQYFKDKFNDGANILFGALVAFETLFPNQQHLLIPLIAPGKGSTKLIQISIGNYQVWTFNLASEAGFTIELPHELDITQDVILHLDWVCTDARTGANEIVTWDLDYSLVTHDNGETLLVPIHSGTLHAIDELIPELATGAKRSIFHIPSSDITHTEEVIGVILGRTTTGNDPAAGTVAILNLHVEYTVSSLGT